MPVTPQGIQAEEKLDEAVNEALPLILRHVTDAASAVSPTALVQAFDEQGVLPEVTREAMWQLISTGGLRLDEDLHLSATQ